ncbi:MAG: hypothetical protein K6E47_07920, partial [Lachnospiraceae bacterium]|nr:hypothetical protein [Lachnospiraceae bacterium]
FVTPVEMLIADRCGSPDGNLYAYIPSEGSADERYRETLYETFELYAQGDYAPIVLPQLEGTNERTAGRNNNGPKWKITKEGLDGEYNNLYKLSTVYCGKALTLPQVGFKNTPITISNGDEDYEKDLLCSYKLSSNGLVSTYPKSAKIEFKESKAGEANVFPFTETGMDGKFVFTVQDVDWLWLDLSWDDVKQINHLPSGTAYSFNVGANNPFIIAGYDVQASLGSYKLAISPLDLFNHGKDFTYVPFNYTPIGDTSSEYYIYAPDDIVYPWHKEGSMRYSGISDDPASVYASMLQSNPILGSYPFIGVNGYKLTGYTASGHDNFIHANGDEQRAYPCTLVSQRTVNGQSETIYESIMNMIPLENWILGNSFNDFAYTVFGNGPITITPIFAPAQIEAELVYTEYPNESTGSYDIKHNCINNYSLKLTGVPQVSGYEISLAGLALDATNMTEGFRNYLLTNIISFNQEGNISGLDEETYNYDRETKTLTISMRGLKCPSSEPLEDIPVAYALSNDSSSGFIRGLNSIEASGEYCPAIVTVVPKEGESYKYSCFYFDGAGDEDNGFARVFTLSDHFSVATPLETGVDEDGHPSATGYYSPDRAGMIMDIVGSGNYGWAYYGGLIIPMRVGNQSDHSGQYCSVYYPLTRQTVLPEATIGQFLGTDYAGIYTILPFDTVTLNNPKTILNEDQTVSVVGAYAYNYDASYQAYTEKMVPVANGNGDTRTWNTFDEKFGSNEYVTLFRQHDGTGRYIFPHSINSENTIYDVPEGFIYFDFNGANNIFLYIGTDAYMVKDDASNPKEINALEHKADVEFAINVQNTH